MNQTPKSDSGVSNDRPPGQKDPLWILLERADHQLAQLIVETLRSDGHRVMDGSQGMSLLLNLVSLGLSPVAPEVSAVVICDARTSISKSLAVLGRLLDQGDYCPPFIPITETSEEDLHDVARRLGALTILTKPLVLNHLRALVQQRQDRLGPGR